MHLRALSGFLAMSPAFWVASAASMIAVYAKAVPA